ncbi:kinesin-like protein KIF14 [Spea bombifrons]|uniref:kinesin-like protein KIF14 n=1 Tax=Spea bombifrons TaxID=233779 RepID=UPI0023498D29|nr:kinesin-like protein KIF14 [Spea bombifrons]
MSQKAFTLNKPRAINRTYVVSACKNNAAMQKTECKLTLQRRETIIKQSPNVEKDVDKNISQPDGTEKRLTLQRRIGTASNAKNSSEDGVKHSMERKFGLPATTGSVIGNELCRGYKLEAKVKGFEVAGSNPPQAKSLVNNGKPLDVGGSEDVSRLQHIKGLTGAKKIDRVNCPKKVGQDVKTPGTQNGSLDRQRTPRSGTPGLVRSASTRDNRHPVVTPKRPGSTLSGAHRKVFSTLGETKTEDATLPSNSLSVKDETNSFPPSLQDDPLKEENCAVTVAVRTRPFSNREITEKSAQVVFMNGQETSVLHPDSKQNHNFHYDFSFWSFDKSHPSYADQKMVFEKLAVPLLEWSILGYNTCLFAYGQTGSGKSYTMMGFDEEPGIIPRFCSDLFSRIQKTLKQKISFHLEMSYFEVYNEKIHDLLVFKADNGQKKQPLRVREHPLLGPYVEELSTNVVSSFQDVQSWLELGNKQRATAATGMNDKSSRSHSVFTLIMTQTKTEYVEGEEHDHRVTSRINLVDLAGSERCATAQTSGERLKEGVSINKSLLTLGKVISALSESSQARKKVFIPYRESVLTWLLKDSLGGNSKTAMIATISPALSHIEETLSTLRYARQARLIINIAKVNEDVNAKLIRELKLEIEKLKASQLSAKNTDSEKYRHCHQEITTLKLKLSQQEKEMSELQRAWKDKLEQAEQRKKTEMKELQKAGITFKMDNRLPNLVNLNEDPQLSEMLLYMIKEGRTTVGKYTAGSNHDIQLSGALIAEDHCVITNIGNTVSIAPSADAKTYVNGNQISETTVLHHGDRVILGGDHYFRFNHPVEVQRLRTPLRASTLPSEGPKDYEFAKNELLTAQRSKLEEEIEEARLTAKEEMMRGIQIAKEMAQQELNSQKTAYEDRIKALEAELKEESRRKQLHEVNTQEAASRIQELEVVKMHLQQEVQMNKRRLEMEALTTRQALEDHKIRHAKILEALEAEKQKIASEVQTLLQEKNNRGRSMAGSPTWNSMKLSVMIQEANKISSNLKKNTTFSRHDITDKENVSGNPVQIKVRNTKLGIVTFWSLEKFEDKFAAMKELDENSGGTKDDDLFYDPGDEWEPDLSNSTVSNFSRRRSLMKNKRISGCLYEIRVHPIQSLQSGYKSGLMNKSSSFLSKSNSVCSNTPDSHLPGICKDLIGSSLDFLGQSHADESNMADSLIRCVCTICAGVCALSQASEQQDADSSDTSFLVNRDAQTHSVQLASAFQQLVVISKHWLDHFPDSKKNAKPADNLGVYIRKLGGYLQLLLQGCCSDISSMVTEARDKASQAAEQILQNIGHLAALTDTELHFSDDESKKNPCLQRSYCRVLCDGMRMGLENLIDAGMKTMNDMQIGIQRCRSHDETELKKSSLALAVLLQNSLTHFKKLDLDMLLRDLAFCVPSNLSRDLLNLQAGLERLSLTTVSLLEGTVVDTSQLITSLEDIASSASKINKNLLPLSPQAISLAELKTLSSSLALAVAGNKENRPCCEVRQVQSLNKLNQSAFSPTAIQWV